MKIKNFFKRALVLLLALTTLTPLLAGCTDKENQVVIYTSAEDYRVEYMRERLTETFPYYDIIIEYLSTGSHAAKLMVEGVESEADISYDLEYGYLQQLEEERVLAHIKYDYDVSIFTKDSIVSDYFLPEYKNGGAIIVNTDVLAKRGLAKPTSYADLLKPEYKNLISMPNPKSSGTGYMFLRSITNILGEEQGFKYFADLTKNILQYTSSGSGPVNALVQEEVAIGLGMTGQAVTAINDGAPLEIIYFEEGSPYCMYGQAIIEGKQNRPAVKEVFDFLIKTYSKENCQKFFPEKIFANEDFEIENYPTNIKYADMKNNTIGEKVRLLSIWEY